MNWYYIDESILSGDRRQGPFSTEEMQELANQKKIKNDTLVWHTGQKEWVTWAKSDGYMSEEKINDLLEQTVNDLLEEQKQHKHFAGFLIRGTAILIDAFILMAVGSAILFSFEFLNLIDVQALERFQNMVLNTVSQTSGQDFDFLKQLFQINGMSLFFSIFALIQAIYFIFFHARYAATVGKLLMHIHVENADGSKLTLRGSVIRYLASILTQATLSLYGIGYLLAAIDPEKRALHDFIARTRVLYNKIPSEPHQ